MARVEAECGWIEQVGWVVWRRGLPEAVMVREEVENECAVRGVDAVAMERMARRWWVESSLRMDL